MNPSAARVASRHLRGADTNMGIDVRSWAKRRESWWSDLATFITKWWELSGQVKVRRVRGKMTVRVDFKGWDKRPVEITVKGS